MWKRRGRARDCANRGLGGGLVVYTMRGCLKLFFSCSSMMMLVMIDEEEKRTTKRERILIRFHSSETMSDLLHRPCPTVGLPPRATPRQSLFGVLEGSPRSMAKSAFKPAIGQPPVKSHRTRHPLTRQERQLSVFQTTDERFASSEIRQEIMQGETRPNDRTRHDAHVLRAATSDHSGTYSSPAMPHHTGTIELKNTMAFCKGQ